MSIWFTASICKELVVGVIVMLFRVIFIGFLWCMLLGGFSKMGAKFSDDAYAISLSIIVAATMFWN